MGVCVVNDCGGCDKRGFHSLNVHSSLYVGFETSDRAKYPRWSLAFILSEGDSAVDSKRRSGIRLDVHNGLLRHKWR